MRSWSFRVFRFLRFRTVCFCYLSVLRRSERLIDSLRPTLSEVGWGQPLLPKLGHYWPLNSPSQPF